MVRDKRGNKDIFSTRTPTLTHALECPIHTDTLTHLFVYTHAHTTDMIHDTQTYTHVTHETQDRIMHDKCMQRTH